MVGFEPITFGSDERRASQLRHRTLSKSMYTYNIYLNNKKWKSIVKNILGQQRRQKWNFWKFIQDVI